MDEETKKILEENLRLNKEIHAMTKKIKNFVIWQQVFGIIKILIFVIPIILGIIYLPPLFKELTGTYQELLNLNPANSINIPSEIEKYLR